MVNRNLPEYKPIKVTFLSEQKVAASKRYNHLYIALRSSIRVYSPAYPNQIVSPNLPYTTLTSSASSNRPGRIDPTEPHAINSLTVGELGFEEVVVSAHDDGDVCVWYTRDLSRLAFRLSVGDSAWGVALHKEQRLIAVSANNHLIHVFELAAAGKRDYPCPEEDTDSGGSHRHRRRRRRKRDSFGCDGEDDSRVKYDQGWKPLPGNDDACKKRRKRTSKKNKAITVLKGHGCNIPNVSFLDDPTGRWLVGTSIDGMVILWDVVTERPVEKCRLGMDNRGWSVLFLKPQVFKPVSNLYEALGKPAPNEGSWGTVDPPKVFLNTAGIKTISTDYYDPVPNSQTQLNRIAKAWDISPGTGAHASGFLGPDEVLDRFIMAGVEYDDEDFSEEDEEDVDLDLDMDEEEDEDEDEEEGDWSEGSADADVEVYVGPGGATVEFVTAESSDSGSSHQPLNSDFGSEDSGHHSYEDSDTNHHHRPPRASLNFYGPVRFVELVRDSDTSSTSPSSSSSPDRPRPQPIAPTNRTAKRTRAHSSSSFKHLSSTQLSSRSGCSSSTSSTSSTLSSSEDEDEEEEAPLQPPTCLIFSTTEHNAHLLTATSTLSPIVLCRSPLPPYHTNHHAANIDRLNLCHVIPELSLVIAASQKGRVAIFRMTRVDDTYCMRLDEVLPRHEDEDELQAMAAGTVLLGVAVGPVQGGLVRRKAGGRRGAGASRVGASGMGMGMGIEGRRRRYRLMCVFVNGRVVSYELGRSSSEPEGGGHVMV